MINRQNLQILLIEGKRGGNTLFVDDLIKSNYCVTHVPNGIKGVTALKEKVVVPHVIVINAASLRTSGIRISSKISENASNIPIILIISEDKDQMADDGADIILKLPFTKQKLTNRIDRYIPPEDKHIITLGPISLNIQTNFLYCNGHVSQLTPRLSHLLKYFMQKPGRIIDREQLFKKVWDTEYIGDTRTLDVHINWLRKAIEKNPHKPKILLTIRSHGYKLEV